MKEVFIYFHIFKSFIVKISEQFYTLFTPYERKAVIKAEFAFAESNPRNLSDKNPYQLLLLEYEVYKHIHKSPTRIPEVYKFLRAEEVTCCLTQENRSVKIKCNLLIMQKLGLDLESCAAFCKEVWS